jgi:hypothetical protein
MVGGYEYSDGVIDKVQFHLRALRADSPSSLHSYQKVLTIRKDLTRLSYF